MNRKTKPKILADSPDLLEQWDYSKNKGLEPEIISMWSRKIVWWKCDKGPDHIWKTTPHNRTGINKTSCPYCNLGGDVELVGYLWERICHRIAQQLLSKEKWIWHPKIETHAFKEKNHIFPEILIEKPDGLNIIIDAKKSPYAIRAKDIEIYPYYASEVVFWCLYMDEQIEVDNSENIIFISSDELIYQLNQVISNRNRRAIERITNDIKKLKEGTLISQQKLLSDFL